MHIFLKPPKREPGFFYPGPPHTTTMGGCASRPKDLNSESPEPLPAEPAGAAEVAAAPDATASDDSETTPVEQEEKREESEEAADIEKEEAAGADGDDGDTKPEVSEETQHHETEGVPSDMLATEQQNPEVKSDN